MITCFYIQDESVPSLRTYYTVMFDPTALEVVLRIRCYNRIRDVAQSEEIFIPHSADWTVQDVFDYLNDSFCDAIWDSNVTKEEMLATLVRETPTKTPNLSLLI